MICLKFDDQILKKWTSVWDTGATSVRNWGSNCFVVRFHLLSIVDNL